MPVTHQDHPNLHIFRHPLIQRKLSLIRDKSTSHRAFRGLLQQITGLMVYEVTRNFPTEPIMIDGPLETSQGVRLRGDITIVPILRAGLGMADGILELVPEACVGHIGLYRDESSLRPVSYYCKLPPDIAAGPVILVDPMLATGGSAEAATTTLKEQGCNDIRMICLVAAPEGVKAMYKAHPDIGIYTAALDRELNEQGYILPGLGDAGDRIFGTQ